MTILKDQGINMERRIEILIGTQRTVGDLHLPDGFTGPFPCVICSHGYKSNRNSEKYFQIGHRFPLEDIAVFRFDHRGALNGESDEKFEDTTLSRRVEDLLMAIDTITEVPEIDSRRLGLLGSSLGGMDVLITKSEKVKARVIMATPFAIPQPSEEMKYSFGEKGYYDFPDGSRINKEFYEDSKRYNLKEEIKKIDCPLLIIQGDQDELVPPHHANILYQNSQAQIKDLKMIKGGDHSFTDLDKLNTVIRLALDWFRQHL
jgi:dipeptidyl aminopeptidase/acylaminoacyl peptidase